MRASREGGRRGKRSGKGQAKGGEEGGGRTRAPERGSRRRDATIETLLSTKENPRKNRWQWQTCGRERRGPAFQPSRTRGGGRKGASQRASTPPYVSTRAALESPSGRGAGRPSRKIHDALRDGEPPFERSPLRFPAPRGAAPPPASPAPFSPAPGAGRSGASGGPAPRVKIQANRGVQRARRAMSLRAGGRGGKVDGARTRRTWLAFVRIRARARNRFIFTPPPRFKPGSDRGRRSPASRRLRGLGRGRHPGDRKLHTLPGKIPRRVPRARASWEIRARRIALARDALDLFFPPPAAPTRPAARASPAARGLWRVPRAAGASPRGRAASKPPLARSPLRGSKGAERSSPELPERSRKGKAAARGAPSPLRPHARGGAPGVRPEPRRPGPGGGSAGELRPGCPPRRLRAGPRQEPARWGAADPNLPGFRRAPSRPRAATALKRGGAKQPRRGSRCRRRAARPPSPTPGSGRRSSDSFAALAPRAPHRF